MPQVPNVAGQPRRVMTQPPVEDDDKAQATPPVVAKDEAIEEPEPALTAADHIPPSQEELAALSIQQQTVVNKRALTPNDPAYKFTDEDRKTAVKARWGEKFDWEEVKLDDALAHLASIRAEVEKGGLILQKRISELRVEKVKCFGCTNIINISEGRWATMRTRNNFETGLPETAYACSAACGLTLNRDFSHPVRVPVSVER